MILRNDFSNSKNAAADQRAGMPGRQRQTRRVRLRTPKWGLSTILLVAKQRCSERGMSSRLMVKRSSSPSSSAAGRVGIVVLQPAGDLAKLGHTVLLIHLPGRAHQRGALGLLLAPQSPERVAKLVISTPLYWSLSAEHALIAVRRAFEPSMMNKRRRAGSMPCSTRCCSRRLVASAFSVAPSRSARTCLRLCTCKPAAASTY
jgi:hypothetical protein